MAILVGDVMRGTIASLGIYQTGRSGRQDDLEVRKTLGWSCIRLGHGSISIRKDHAMRARQVPVRLSVSLLTGALILGLAGCGTSGGSAGAQPQETSTLDALPPSQLAAAAGKEGTFTWYTTFTDKDVHPIVAAFNKAYPKIKVNPLRLSADKIPPRIITEQRGQQYNADVVSGDSPQLSQLLQAGALQPYTPKDLPPLPKGLKMPKGYRGIVYANTTAIAYNPTALKKKGIPVPTSWDDLAEPAWKGQFSIDPAAVNWYDALIETKGHDKALALLKRLGKNKPVFVESHTQALTNVQAGEPLGAATTYGYKDAALKKDTPTEVAFANPSPLPASLNLIDVVTHAPHPAAARLFVDWVVSEQGQQAVVDVTNHVSTRKDVSSDPTVWDESKWPAVWGDPNLPSKKYNDELAEMKSALRAP